MRRKFQIVLSTVSWLVFVTASHAAVKDFNGRWDLEVHSKPSEISFTTKAWWIEVTGAGTPDMKVKLVGSPDGSLDDITESRIENGVLHFAWVRGEQRIEYEARYDNGALEG